MRCAMPQTFMSGIIIRSTTRSFTKTFKNDALCHAPDIYVWDNHKVNNEILHKNVQDDERIVQDDERIVQDDERIVQDDDIDRR
ncbi:hypothetical protein BMS3Bbin04_01382 [bacterium BMS3Bbin04]|nr:hypothetical protein BMS3Bbin04_01382 [bacterium BMS3Bbin04]